MKISSILQIPSVKVLLFIYEKREVRYAELARLIGSRGTLSVLLKELEGERLVERSVVTARPIQTYYALTDLGKEVAGHLQSVRSKLRG